jgi:uncharacterized protein (DUF1330 family)
MSHVDPTREQFDAFKALDRDSPIQMLNLLRFRDKAVYPDGRPSDLTGAEAYALYGKTSGPIFARLGGRQVFLARPQALVIGPEDEAWDLMFVAQYPNAGAFMAMVTDPDYKKAVIHRQAAVADSRLLRMAPSSAGPGFGEAG